MTRYYLKRRDTQINRFWNPEKRRQELIHIKSSVYDLNTAEGLQALTEDVDAQLEKECQARENDTEMAWINDESLIETIEKTKDFVRWME